MLIKQLMLDYLIRELTLDKQYTTLINANSKDRTQLRCDGEGKYERSMESDIDGNHLTLSGTTR